MLILAPSCLPCPAADERAGVSGVAPNPAGLQALVGCACRLAAWQAIAVACLLTPLPLRCRAEVSGTIVKILCENGDAVLPGAWRCWCAPSPVCMIWYSWVFRPSLLLPPLPPLLVAFLRPSSDSCAAPPPHVPSCRPAAVHHQALNRGQPWLCGCSIAQLNRTSASSRRPTRRSSFAPLSIPFRCTLLCSSCHAASGQFCAPVLVKWMCIRSTLLPHCIQFLLPPHLPSQLFLPLH